MNSTIIYKTILSSILVGSYFLLPKYGFTFFDFTNWQGYFLYPFSHANIWHLLGNILCLFMLRCPMHLIASYIIAVICSFLPSFQLSPLSSLLSPLSEPTCGFSGVLFAIVGISWGRVHRFREMMNRNKWILIIPAFIPHINFLIHLYCLLAGYLYGSVCCRFTTTLKSKSCALK